MFRGTRGGRLLKLFFIFFLVLATSGIDYDIKLWTPTSSNVCPLENAHEVWQKFNPMSHLNCTWYNNSVIQSPIFDQNVPLFWKSHSFPCHPVMFQWSECSIKVFSQFWLILNSFPNFTLYKYFQVIARNERMLRESRDTLTVPASFMIRVLSSLHRVRFNGKLLLGWILLD